MVKGITGDTAIALVDGTSINIEELAIRTLSGEKFWGYAINELGNVAQIELFTPKLLGRDKVVNIILSNNYSFKTTINTKILLDIPDVCQPVTSTIINSILGKSLMSLIERQHPGNLEPLKIKTALFKSDEEYIYTLTSAIHGNFALACGVIISSN